MENQSIILDKVVKVSIIVGSLMITISVAYYLVIFLPQKEQNRIEQQKQEKMADERNAIEQEEKNMAKELEVKIAKCFEDANKFHQEYIKTVDGYYNEPKYNYNEKLGRCLYSGGYRKKSVLFSDKEFDKKVKSPEYHWERVVKDVYTNETILVIYNFQDTETITARDKEIEELMSN